jgi:hypothetical protein
MTKTHALWILAIKPLETASSMMFPLNWLQQRQPITAKSTPAMLLVESSLPQRFAQQDHLVPPLAAILQLDVFILQLFANPLDVQLTLATHLLTNVKSLFLIAMMEMLAPTTASIHPPAAFTLQNVLLLTLAPPQLVLQDNALTFLKIATTATHAQPTPAISTLELVLTLLLFVLAALEALELAILKLLNASSTQLVTHLLIVMTVIQLTSVLVPQLDVSSQ